MSQHVMWMKRLLKLFAHRHQTRRVLLNMTNNMSQQVGPQRPGPQREKMNFNTYTGMPTHAMSLLTYISIMFDNIVTLGHIEDGDMNAVQFEDQMRTFASRGYAMDPSVSHQMSQRYT